MKGEEMQKILWRDIIQGSWKQSEESDNLLLEGVVIGIVIMAVSVVLFIWLMG